MQDGTVLTVFSVKLVTETCCECGMVFAMPDGFHDKRLQDGKSFFCPAGHSQYFLRRARREEELERQLAAAKGNEKFYYERYRAEREAFEAERRSKAAIKGQLTKVKKRAAAGVCTGCNRTFQNVARHMKTQHPELVAGGGEGGES